MYKTSNSKSKLVLVKSLYSTACHFAKKKRKKIGIIMRFFVQTCAWNSGAGVAPAPAIGGIHKPCVKLRV